MHFSSVFSSCTSFAFYISFFPTLLYVSSLFFLIFGHFFVSEVLSVLSASQFCQFSHSYILPLRLSLEFVCFLFLPSFSSPCLFSLSLLTVSSLCLFTLSLHSVYLFRFFVPSLRYVSLVSFLSLSPSSFPRFLFLSPLSVSFFVSSTSLFIPLIYCCVSLSVISTYNVSQ